jgi:ribonuclease HII
MTLILGIDDAARGPVIGPMILAGVLVEKEKDVLFKESGIKDSKLLLHPKRVELLKTIKEHSIKTHFVKVFPNEIDDSINTGTNLNTLEAKKAAEIINEINSGKIQKETIKVILDCPSVNLSAWRSTLIKFIKHINNLNIVCEHKADFNHPSVSAASILAKVMREEEISKLKEKFKEYGNMGSGYPADPYTKEFLEKNGEKLKDSGLFRKTWATWKALFPEKGKKQSSLEDFK